MSLLDCPQCWELDCRCGYLHLRHMKLDRLREFAALFADLVAYREQYPQGRLDSHAEFRRFKEWRGRMRWWSAPAPRSQRPTDRCPGCQRGLNEFTGRLSTVELSPRLVMLVMRCKDCGYEFARVGAPVDRFTVEL